jgi:hypothetical protein
MLKIRTMERCPECDAIVYIRLYPNSSNIVANVYLDRDAILHCTNYFQNEPEADYECSMCGWEI